MPMRKIDEDLQNAALSGRLSTLQELLSKKAEVNAKDTQQGLTALMLASMEGQLACLEELLRNSAEIEAKDIYGGTALMLASEYGNLKCLEELLRNSAEINSKSKPGETALSHAARMGELGCLQELLRKNADIDSKDTVGSTALMVASMRGHPACLQELLRKKAEINYKDTNGWTALMLASEQGNLKCLEELIQRGADHTAVEKKGKTALDYAKGPCKEYLQNVAAEKYDGELEKQVTAWIVEITRESFESKGAETFAQFLNDGTVLCHLVNMIMPGKIAKVNTMKAPFKKMENIAKFTDAARAVGVPEPAMFATPDLYEEQNLGSVVNCLYTFARVIQTAAPDFQGPKLGAGMAGDQVHDAGRGKQLATQTGGLAGTLHDEKKGTGARERAVLPPAGGEAVAEADAQGLDADMKRKMEEKFDHGLEAEVCKWIEAVTGDAKGDQSTAEWLKSGQVLCKLGNAIKPGSIKGVSASSMPFNQMENIKKFNGMAREIGMNESSCFSTPDLFEEKNMGIVITSLNTFGGVVKANVPEYSGPSIGVAVKAHVEDASRGIGLITDQKDVFQATMQVERPTNTGIIRG